MFHVEQKYDVIVVGGGHAGCEASLACARMGLSTALITLDPSKIGEMSCNPSIGGVGKGQLVKELDALGGEMGKNADYTGIQFKRLNTRKGSAVQSSRCQSDKKKYALRMQSVISDTPKLTILEAEVKGLLVVNAKIEGVNLRLKEGAVVPALAKAVVITTGTFMRGLLHCGEKTSAGGRIGEGSSVGLSDDLAALGFTINRLKTGTPPRLKSGSIDFSKMELQAGDVPPMRFSFADTQIQLPQVPCYLTYTNERTHEVIRQNLSRSPLYSGQIKGVGPRYCPSIEDKVVKFPDKDRHPLFFEPEALDSDLIYPNGISTSLPPDVQEAFVRTLPGCENAEFARHGYAVEYDCIDPRQLKKTFEAVHVEGLFLAGQINGTSGYEEAAIQGLLAGINAALKVKEASPLVIGREEGYAGVLVDDLTSLGVNEPYRMFTSRAEYRLSLREDNADLRLRRHGIRIGLVTQADQKRSELKLSRLESAMSALRTQKARPNADSDAYFKSCGTQPMKGPQTFHHLLKRPELDLLDIGRLFHVELFAGLSEEERETLEIEVKYEGYIAMQKDEIARLQKMQNVAFPANFSFDLVKGLSTEIREKLNRNQPRTLEAAARISGVTPAALITLVHQLRSGGARVHTTGAT